MGPITHLTAGVLVGASIGTATGQPLVGVIAGSVGAILPDIDHPGTILNKIIGHRTITHKIEFVLICSVLILTLLSSTPYAVISATSFAAGGVSHLLLDAITRSGIRPTLFLPIHLKGPIRSGNILIEMPLILVMSLCIGKIMGVSI